MDKLEVSDRWMGLYRTKSWIDLLKEASLQHPDIEAIVVGEKRVTYKCYWDKVVEYAKGLHAIGVRKGSHVGVWMTNRV